MTHPFGSIMDGQSTPDGRTHQSGRDNTDAGNAKNHNPDATSGNVVPLRPATSEQSPNSRYLDQNIDLELLPIPIVRFPGTKMVLPDHEAVCLGWSEFLEEVAPEPAPIFQRKDRVPYYIAGTLKEAEFVNRTREKRLKNGQGTVGKQRSSAHIETLGPAVFLDDDGDVFAREPALRALGVAAAIYSSFSFGFAKGEVPQPARGGRVVLLLNRGIIPSEYGLIWDAINHLFGGGFDEHGRSTALCYGRHARRSDRAPYRRLIIEGAVLNADALIEIGHSLRPKPNTARSSKTRSGRQHAPIEEIERARLMGAVRPPDDYGEWVSGAAAFKRAFPDNVESAFDCYDAWSACSSKYEGGGATRTKFDQVPVDYDGVADPVTVDMLHWRARRRAERVINTLYSPVTQWPKPAAAFDGLPLESLTEGIPRPKGAEWIPPDSLKPEDGITALEYLKYCWSDKVCQEIVADNAVPQPALDEAQRRAEERREKVALTGRALHTWEGKNLAADTAALAEKIIASSPKLYRIDQTIVRISQPISDPTTAARVRKMYGYTGKPGEPDPALHAGERPVPILPADAEALRELIAEHVATKRVVNDGTKKRPIWRKQITSFAFKPSAKLHEEPDAGVLKDLLKRELLQHVPEVLGVITAPVMPALPMSTRDLLQPGADRILTNPGFDAASGLYLSPVGSIAKVPDSPSRADLKEAGELLRKPWADFPFASPADGIDSEVSRSVAVYGTMLAVNRRALEIAPGIAFSSHGEGMSSGKTLASEVIGIVATGDVPAPVSLSPDFNEQRKEIITHLVQGDGCLFLDNIPTGTRFDSAPLSAAMTNPRFKARLLGTNKQIEASTRAMIVANGNALNCAGDLASRLLRSCLDTGLERPEDRSVIRFQIPDLRQWVTEHRQQLIAAVHTVVRAYLQDCRECQGTPPTVKARRQVEGTRFGGACEVLRDAFLWAFPDLPDPFLAFKASALNSSTKAEAALVLTVLDRVMTEAVGQRTAPTWATTTLYSGTKCPEQQKWEQKFRARWVSKPDQLRHRYRTNDLNAAAAQSWEHVRSLVRIRCGRREVRAGRIRFTSAALVAALDVRAGLSSERAIVEGAMQGKPLNPVSLGRWLKERLVDAPIDGRVLRSALGREKCATFWIERRVT